MLVILYKRQVQFIQKHWTKLKKMIVHLMVVIWLVLLALVLLRQVLIH